jgi:putative transposase
VERTREALGELMSRQLSDLRMAVMMLDGIELKGRMMIVALGSHRWRQDSARPVGRIIRERDRRHRFVVRPGRARPGSRAEDAVLIDGSKTLRKAMRTVFGDVPVPALIRHKERSVMQHLPERDRRAIKARLRSA